MTLTMTRHQYVDLYGPTTGDRVRLADSDLILEVEHDAAVHGEEITFGGGKVIRDGMGQSARAVDVPDLVITNALIVDHWGIVKADIGIRNGRIVGIGKAGNPDVMDGVDPNLVVGAGTEIIAGEHLIVTAGGIDTHVHLICPQQTEEAIASGVTTMLGGGTGPTTGTSATNCTPGPWNIHRMLEAADTLPVNIGIIGKGSSSRPESLRQQVDAGACALKIHEDWGATPATITTCLDVADVYDIQVAIHSDSINEAGFVERTISAIGGRTIHAYHTEGAGGGHAPDIIRIAGLPNVIPSSNNPARPYTVNTVEEHLDMLMVAHHLDPKVPEDVAFADSRIRAETMMAEDVLHDIGAFSIMSSDSQAMGRVGEVILRTWQSADKMKKQRGPLSADSDRNDNARIKRYLAKYTINPAIAHGLSDVVGSVEVGKLADLVLWEPKFFGVRPALVLKGGLIAWAAMGDANASISTPQPVFMRPMYAALIPHSTTVMFVSQAAHNAGIGDQLGLRTSTAPVGNTRTIGKAEMIHNNATPDIQVDPETFEVRADGELLVTEPASELPLAQRYFLF